MTILVTNDDGVNSAGIVSLSEALRPMGEVFVVAPESEMSAASHSLTLNRPLRIERIDDQVMSVDGTPTDCVLVAVQGILDSRPDLVISGINRGPNLGDDVTYSGTVAAALEATLLSIPSIAISLASSPGSKLHFETAASFARHLAQRLTESPLPPATLLNINVPNLAEDEIGGVEITRLGRRVYADVISEGLDPNGHACFLIEGAPPIWEEGEGGTDFAAIEASRISITPLLIDMTDHSLVSGLRDWGRGLELSFRR